MGCELHKKCAWRPSSARTRWGDIALPQTP